MVVEGFEFVAAELARLLRLNQKSLGRALSVLPVEVLGEKELLPASEPVTPLALELDVLLFPPRGHTRPAHEVPGVYLGPMSDRSASVALTHPSVVTRPQADVLGKHRVHLLHHRAPVCRSGTGCAPTARS